MTSKLLALAAATAFGSVGARADGGASQTVPDTLQLELTPDGLNAVAAIVKDNALNDLTDVALPDIQQDLLLGTTLSLQGIKASVSFDSLKLVPADGVLNLNAGLHAMKIDIGFMSLSKSVLGVRLGATCKNTEFDIAPEGVVFFNLGMLASVESDNIDLSEQSLNFKVSSDNYAVQGPAACSGPLIGEVTRLVLHEALVMVRPFLQELVKNKLQGLLPVVAQQINEQVHVSADLDLKGLPSLPERTAELAAFPSKLTLASTGMKVVLGTSISDITGQRRESIEAGGVTGPARYGSVGLNPGVVTAAFNVLWPQGSDWYDLSSMAAALLTTDGMASIWPDLSQIKTTDPAMHLQVRLGGAPQLGTDPVLNALTVHVPQLQLKFQISQNNQWIDYFIMNLDLGTGVTTSIADQVLAVQLVQNSTANVSGNWAPNYRPTDSRFQADSANMIFSSLLQLVASGTLVRENLPQITIGSYTFLLANPHVDGEFYAVDFTGP